MVAAATAGGGGGTGERNTLLRSQAPRLTAELRTSLAKCMRKLDCPKMPPMRVVELEEGRWLVALGGGAADEPDHIAATWLFYVTSLSPTRSRLISRFRVGYAAASKRGRRMFGPYLTEAIGFVMDRRMLLGVKERAERISQGSSP